jgi:mannose-6-phosphate isomerase-like protein (cupin superfamily)
VSGATDADEDRELAQLGVGSLQAAIAARANGGTDGAAHFPAAAVNDKFRAGGLLLDTDTYKIDAGRREGPGEVEYHERVVDVMHVVNGRATVVTGGAMVNPREVAPGELRAEAVNGGRTRELSEGDVLAIPNGVPHQFTDVSDPFLYFVVKVPA